MDNPLKDWIFNKTGGESIDKYQLEKINETLRLVSNKSVFYKKHYNGVDISSVKNFDDFEKLPFITAEDLSAFGSQMLCVPQNEIERIVTLQTSGTQGEPKRIYFTADDQELTVDFFNAGMRCLVDENDSVLILLPCKTPGSAGDLLRLGLERIGCSVYPYGIIEDFGSAGRFIIEQKITSLVGNPVQVLKLAEVASEQRLNIKLNTILLSTDYVPDTLTNRLSSLWNCAVFEHYGMTEMCFGGGVYCKNLKGYHMREADLYFEIISDKGETLPDGEYGEVIFTTLTRTGMPLIRYRTGDYGRFIKERCDCAPELRLMEKIKRRTGSGITIGNKEFFISDFDEIFFSCEKIVDYSLTIKNEKLIVDLITTSDIADSKSLQKSFEKRKIMERDTNGTEN